MGHTKDSCDKCPADPRTCFICHKKGHISYQCTGAQDRDFQPHKRPRQREPDSTITNQRMATSSINKNYRTPVSSFNFFFWSICSCLYNRCEFFDNQSFFYCERCCTNIFVFLGRKQTFCFLCGFSDIQGFICKPCSAHLYRGCFTICFPIIILVLDLKRVLIPMSILSLIVLILPPTTKWTSMISALVPSRTHHKKWAKVPLFLRERRPKKISPHKYALSFPLKKLLWICLNYLTNPCNKMLPIFNLSQYLVKKTFILTEMSL